MSAYSDKVIADGAVAYWRLGESSGTTASDSVGSAHGTISGGVTLSQSGALAGDSDKAMAFASGAIDVPVGSYSAFGTGPLTLECWYWSAAAGFQHLIDDKNTGSNAAGVNLYVSGGNTVNFRLGSGAAMFEYPVSRTIGNSQWHHIVTVLRRGASDVAETYVDGTLAGSDTLPATGWNLTTTWPFRIGSQQQSLSGGCNGRMDEVAIYPTALSATQIQAHYNLGRTNFPVGSYPHHVISDGASAYWRLGETSGTIANDEIGTADGTISGGVTLAQPGALADGNNAMLFDGTTGKVAIPNGSFLAIGTNPCALEWWVRTSQNADDDYAIDFKENSTSTIPGVGFWMVPGAVRFLVSTGVGAQITLNVVFAYNDNQWHHIVGVVTRGAPDTAWVYIDGIQRGQLALLSNGGSLTQSTNAVAIACRAAGAGGVGTNFFPGSIDEVAIYPTALTAPQIAAHYAAREFTLGSSWPGVPWWVQISSDEGDAIVQYNRWLPITPSDTVDFANGVTDGIWVGGAGDIAAVSQDNQMPVVIKAVPAGSWLPLNARRINANGTTASSLVALYII